MLDDRVVNRALALLVLMLSGCIVFDSAASPESACLNLCDCLESVPSAVDECVVECTAEAGAVGQECLDCVATASCDELEDPLTACAVECQGAASLLVEE